MREVLDPEGMPVSREPCLKEHLSLILDPQGVPVSREACLKGHLSLEVCLSQRLQAPSLPFPSELLGGGGSGALWEQNWARIDEKWYQGAFLMRVPFCFRFFAGFLRFSIIFCVRCGAIPVRVARMLSPRFETSTKSLAWQNIL